MLRRRSTSPTTTKSLDLSDGDARGTTNSSHMGALYIDRPFKNGLQIGERGRIYQQLGFGPCMHDNDCVRSVTPKVIDKCHIYTLRRLKPHMQTSLYTKSSFSY